MRRCMAHHLAASNPVRRVTFFNEDNSRLRYLTEDEYDRLLQAAKKIETLYNQRIPDYPYTFAHAKGRNAGEPVQDVKDAFQTALEQHTFASWLIMQGASLRSRSPSCWAIAVCAS